MNPVVFKIQVRPHSIQWI